MNNKAQLVQTLAVGILLVGFMLIAVSQGGLLSITGFAPATAISCGEVNESLNLSADIIGSFQCFNITAPNIVFDCKGHSITGSDITDSTAIWVNNSAQNNITIQNCEIKNYYYGAYVNVTTNVTFLNNTFFNNSYGAHLGGSHYSEFIRNNFTENQYSISGTITTNYGVLFYNNTFVATTPNYGVVSLHHFPVSNFTHNKIRITSGTFSYVSTGWSSSYMTNNDFIVGGDVMSGQGAASNTIMHNRFNITAFTWGAVYQYDSTGYRIINNTFIGSGTGYAIGVNRHSDHTVVENNTISGFAYGIATGSSAYNYPVTYNYTIRNNNISNSDRGVYVGQTYNSLIINNKFDNLTEYGIYFTGSPAVFNNTLQDNSITNTPTTIYSTTSQSNRIINSSYRVQTDYASVDFGISTFNISYNISSNIEDIRFTERIAAIDSTKVPGLNKSANISYRVVSCLLDYDIRYKETYEKSPSAFSEADPLCNSTSTPACTNIVCANDWVNFTVEHFSSYGTLPSCITPRDDYQIISNGVICDGSYTLTSGMDVLQDDIFVSCNNTKIYGPATGNALDIIEINNITIQNCFIDRFYFGLYLDNVTNSAFINNTFNKTVYSSLYIVGGSTNNTIENNALLSPVRGIYLHQSSGNNIINLDTTSTTFFDVQSQSSRNNLILTKGESRVVFENKSINISNIDNIFINDSIVSVNASAEPAMNTSANITLTAVSGCPTTIYYYPAFTTNATLAMFEGQECNSTTTPACTNINCTGNTVSFGVPHFDTYVAEFNLVPVISNIILNSTNISTNYTEENLTCYANATDGNGENITYYGSWNLNGLLYVGQNFTSANQTQGQVILVGSLSSSLTSVEDIFSCSITPNDGIEDGITVLSNNITILTPCIDDDGDGYGVGQYRAECTYSTEDCNDNNASIYPPSSGAIITSDVLFCSGTYNVTSSMDITANDVTVGCNNTIIYNNNQGGPVIDSTNIDGTTIKNCEIRNAEVAIEIDGNNNHILNNTIINMTGHGIEVGGVNNTFTENTIINVSGGHGFEAIDNTYNSSFIGNYLKNTGTGGIFIDEHPSNQNSFINNTIINSSSGGDPAIYACGAGGNTFIGNNLTKGFDGISDGCSNSNNDIVANNTIKGFSNYAIHLNINTNNGIIRGNVLSDGTTAVRVAEGDGNNIVIDNNEIRNFSSRGIYFRGSVATNLSITNNYFANVQNAVNEVYLDTALIENNTIINSTGDVMFFLGENNPNVHITIRNNHINCLSGNGVSLDANSIYNISFSNNRVINCSNGILSSGNGIKNSHIYSNSFINNSIRGISFEYPPNDDNVLQNNTFIGNTKDIFSDSNAINTLIIQSSGNELKFTDKHIDVTDMDQVYIGTRLASVNSSLEQVMNTSAQITLAGLNNPLTPTIYRYENFTTDPSVVVNNGIECNATICTDVTYSSGTLVFNVTRFSSYAVPVYTAPSPPSGGCTPDWSCGSWSACQPDGTQSRICEDLDGCDPDEIRTQSCDYCTDECTLGAKQCSGLNVQTCGNYDADSCTEWATTSTCGVGEVCQAGICVGEEVPPVEEFPTPIDTETSIDLSKVDPNPFSCVMINKTEVTETAISSLSESPYYKEIEEGYETIVTAFSVACSNAEFDISFTIPDNYIDVKALRCKEGQCGPVEIIQVQQLVCGGEIFKELSRTTTYLEPELFPVNITKEELKPGQNVLETSRNKIKFIGDVQGTVTLEQPTEPVKEAENPGIKIIGTPVIMTFEKANPGLATEITLPYVLPEKIDEFSIAMYVRINEQWKYLGGTINKTEKIVTANIEDITQYAENNKVTLALMGLPCLVCLDTELTKVYQGESRDAVILVHGFESSPARYEDILNDIMLTNQPWQAWTFGYPSHKNIDETAKDFADLLQIHSREFDYVYLAAHSMGGLVTQQMLRYAYEQNQIRANTYTFMDKIKKVIIIAAPNKGSLSKRVYEDLFNFLLNNRVVKGLFNLNSAVLEQLIEGKTIERVPGIDYYVIAGTRPYSFTEFMEDNDGIVAIDSAQLIGDSLVDNQCEDYWELDVTHTDILVNYDSRKIIERIVAKEIAESLAEKAIMGYNQYFDMHVSDCSPDDQYIIIGKLIAEEAAPVPAECGCGNGVCGVDEDEVSCPSDCAEIRETAGMLWAFVWLIIKSLLWLLLIVALLVGMFKTAQFLVLKSEYAYKKAEEAIAGIPRKSKIEEKLNDLIVQIRINARLGNLTKAVELYEHFDRTYSESSIWTKDKFSTVRNELEQEMRKRLN